MADVITGEAVALELPVATFPSRIAALLIDMIAQFTLLLIVIVVFVGAAGSVSTDYGTAAFLTAYVLVLVAYPTTFETMSRGKTLGKMSLGIRVIGDDGSPVRFRQALVRALVGVFEIWTFVLAPVGLITSIISARGKRVGDIFAGTYVIQERVPARPALPYEFAVVPPPLAGWATVLQVARLSDQTAEAAGSYLRRFTELSPQARDSIGIQLANAVAAQVSPPPPVGTPPAAYLSAVLAVRRHHEQTRFAALQPAPLAPPGLSADAAPAAHTPWQGPPVPATPASPPTATAESRTPETTTPEAAIPDPAIPDPAIPDPAIPEPAIPEPAMPETTPRGLAPPA